MHDIWFANKIIGLLKEKVAKDSAKSVTVNVTLSPFTHVTQKSLLDAFETLSSKEGLSGVTVNVKTNKISVKCNNCKAATKISKPITSCPECGSGDFEIENGQEFVIDSIEINKT